MKVIERINNRTKTLFSYELLPPPRGSNIHQIIKIVEQLKPYNPAWINVTSHASSLVYIEGSDGKIIKQIHKKRPGTLGVCGIIQNKYNIDAVAHVLCQGFSKEETENLLIELNYLGIENILALKGDNLNYDKTISREKSANRFSTHLVQQVNQIKQGKFLDGTEYNPIDFCVGVAGYPEKHFESANLELDLNYLLQKVNAGAEYIITQMFFDNNKFFDFVKKCREIGIHVPIIPGIKILKSVKQLNTIPKLFHVDIPYELVEKLNNNPDNGEEIGSEFAKKQVQELIDFGVPVVHFFLMNDANSALEIVKQYT